MSGLDIALCVLILIGCFSGLKEGFLMGIFSLLAIVLGILGAFKLMGMAMVLLMDEFDINQTFLPYIAFAVVFVVIVIAVRLLGNVLKYTIDRTFLGRLDQLGGAVLGMFKTVFLLSVVLWILDSLTLSLPAAWVEHSVLLPFVTDFAPVLTDWISEIFPFFGDIF